MGIPQSLGTVCSDCMKHSPEIFHAYKTTHGFAVFKEISRDQMDNSQLYPLKSSTTVYVMERAFIVFCTWSFMFFWADGVSDSLF
jgi:hypothetical protein